MKIYVDVKTQSFHDSRLSPVIPDGAVEITADQRIELLRGLASQMVIVLDQEGIPALAARSLSLAELSVIERAWRDDQVSSLLWVRDRHRDQVEAGLSTTLTSEEFSELLVYLQQLRDWPQSDLFPASEHRPVEPAWLKSQIP